MIALTRYGLVSPIQKSELSTNPHLGSCFSSSALSMVSIYEAAMERNPCTEWLPYERLVPVAQAPVPVELMNEQFLECPLYC